MTTTALKFATSTKTRLLYSLSSPGIIIPGAIASVTAFYKETLMKKRETIGDL